MSFRGQRARLRTDLRSSRRELRRFGEPAEQAVDHAARRILEIRAAADRLSDFPIRGAGRDDVLPGMRYVTIDRAIYWFDVDEAARKVRILAVFFGGQDHVRRMLLRMLRRDEAG